MKIKIDTGNHEFIGPIHFKSDSPIMNHNFLLIKDNAAYPVQYAGETSDGKHEYAFICGALDEGITEFETASGDIKFNLAESVVTNDSVDINIGGEKYTSYYFGTDIPRPYLGPFHGANGEAITRHGYTGREHRHHRNIWFSHGDVNGTDIWNETGFIINKEITEINNGYVYTQFTAKNIWTHKDKSPIADDITTIRIYNTSKNRRIIDASLTLTANYGEVTLGATKEAGPLAVRMADNYIVPNGGTIENSFGGINENEIWMKSANWNDYYGTSELGNVYGVAIFDNPNNIGYPTYFHTRDYGLMAPNNFYIGGEVKIPSGNSVTYKYRIVIHSGNTQKAKISQLFNNYITVPKVTLINN